jgi:hypothetical protein
VLSLFKRRLGQTSSIILVRNDGPTISVKIMAGIPSLTPEEMGDSKNMQDAYNRLSFGGSTRKS